MPQGKVSVTAGECCSLSFEKKYILKIKELKAEFTGVSFLLTSLTHFLLDALRHFSLSLMLNFQV